jgi:4-hydroxybenzoate polyprenyltransferase
MASLLQRISESSRSRDWRLSLLPFIMGCVYLWIWHFKLPLSGGTLLLITLSLVTATGFAALGYLINEFFDQKHDALAGKANRLTPLSVPMQGGVLLAAILAAFSPWFWLPADGLSWCLIGTQLGLFLLYSLPFPRLKAVPVVSNLVDMGYAYVVPMALSFHTYALYSDGNTRLWFYALLATVALVGFRNILVHQVNDVFNDRRAGMRTLPQVLGPKGTAIALIVLLGAEVSAFLLFGFLLASAEPWMSAIPVFFSIFCAGRVVHLRDKIALRFIPLEEVRHLTDPFYQLVFPTILLFALAVSQPWWMLLLLLHGTALMPWYLFKDAFRAMRAVVPQMRRLMWLLVAHVRHWASCMVNYPIYWGFRLFGIDLIREQRSALDFLRSKFT